MMARDFVLFDICVKRRGRTWRWCVSTADGDVIMHGRQVSRGAAQYSATRALFLLLLSAPYRRQANSVQVGRRLGQFI
jgi:hypothetical protein